MTGMVNSSSRCCLLAGGFRSLSLRWQNHICSCLSVSPNCTDSSTRFVSFGYESSAPTQRKPNPRENQTQNSTKISQKQTQNIQDPQQSTNLHRSSREPPAGRASSSRASPAPFPRIQTDQLRYSRRQPPRGPTPGRDSPSRRPPTPRRSHRPHRRRTPSPATQTLDSPTPRRLPAAKPNTNARPQHKTTTPNHTQQRFA